MSKHIKKNAFRVGLILGLLIFIGDMIMSFNSVDSLIKYKDVQLKANKDGKKLTFGQGYAYKRKNVPVQVSLSGTHYEMGLKSVIIKYNPKGYNSYVAISFPGFIGVSTGYSSKGLGYSHHSRFARTVNMKGYPQHCVSRLALEECSSLKDVKAFYKNKAIAIGDAHTWSDRNSRTGCIIEAAPNEKDPTKVIEMNSNIQWHINKYIHPEYISQAENKYTGDESFNNSRQEIMSQLIKKNNNRKLSLDDVISILREENGPDGENYNLSSITRGICNIDTQQMIIFDPKGTGLYIARNYYYASKSTVYFIPWDFEKTPYVYKKSENIDPVLQDTAKIKEALISQSELIKKLKELTVKYPKQGYLYFMVGQTSFDAGNLADWAKYIEKAYKLSSSCDRQDVFLERAKVAFYEKNMQLTGEILSNINYEGLRSFKSKAQLLYLYKMYYNKVNNKINSQKYEKKFLLLVSDKKTQNQIVKSLKVLKN